MSFIDNIVDKVMGRPAALNEPIQFVRPNRHEKRKAAAQRLRVASLSSRRVHEKRGAPGRASKGRKPLRHV